MMEILKVLKRAKGITANSKEVKEGYIFVAIRGTQKDGHDFIEEAVNRGAKIIVLEDRNIEKKIKEKYPFMEIYLVENSRKTLAVLAKHFYGKPDEKVKIIGVTGTNGKTTVSNLIYQYLELKGLATGIVGTIEYRFSNTVYGTGRTTPEATLWFRLLKDMKEKGAEYISAEVSSHAVDQYRVYGTVFQGGIFTNLSREHLDYHQNMENYYQAKKRFFDEMAKFNRNAVAVVNIDNSYGKRLYDEIKEKLKTISYGKNKADFKIKDIEISVKGTEFSLEINGKRWKIHSNLLGEFNVYNLVGSIALLNNLGFDLQFLIENAVKLKPIKGRFETVYSGKFLVVNDYAHTPDALENVLSSLKKIKHNRLIVVFGAGGNRDKTKRPLMGKLAEQYADTIILTSDNPRFENPEDIIIDIKKGIKRECKIYLDREKAIKDAIFTAEEGDIVLIAGKGHENYQIIKDKKIPFDDTEVALRYIKERGL